MKILGLDPSFVNTGIALLNHENGNNSIIDLGLVVTKSSNTKVRKNFDDYSRAVFLLNSLTPWLERADCICVELPQISGANVQARSMWGSGIVLGVLASINKPVVLLTPTEVKLSTGNKTASKEEVIAWAMSLYPHAPWRSVTRKGVTSYTHNNEHIADAVAAAHAGLGRAIKLLEKSV